MAATAVNVAPFTMKDISLVFGPSAGTQYEFKTAASSATFTPSFSTVTWTGLGSNQYTDVTTPTWVLDLEYAQDWDTANSLSKYLLDNAGATVDCTFKPKSASAKTVTAKVIINPGPIGGGVNAVATGSVQLGVVGTPTIA